MNCRKVLTTALVPRVPLLSEHKCHMFILGQLSGNGLRRFLGASCNTATANDRESIDRVV